MTVLFTFLKVSCKLYFTSFEIDLIVIISVTFPNEGFSLIPINAIVLKQNLFLYVRFYVKTLLNYII